MRAGGWCARFESGRAADVRTFAARCAAQSLVAPESSSALRDDPSREAWQVAVDARHGRALPLELLDLSREVARDEAWPALVEATLRRCSADANPLLRPRSVRVARGVAEPYAP